MYSMRFASVEVKVVETTFFFPECLDIQLDPTSIHLRRHLVHLSHGTRAAHVLRY